MIKVLTNSIVIKVQCKEVKNTTSLLSVDSVVNFILSGKVQVYKVGGIIPGCMYYSKDNNTG